MLEIKKEFYTERHKNKLCAQRLNKRFSNLRPQTTSHLVTAQLKIVPSILTEF